MKALIPHRNVLLILCKVLESMILKDELHIFFLLHRIGVSNVLTFSSAVKNGSHFEVDLFPKHSLSL